MKLPLRLMLALAVTALFSVSLTGYLSDRAALDRVPRAFGVTSMPRRAAGVVGPADERPAMMASRALLAELRRATAQAAAIALVVALLVGAALALRISRPISALTQVTRRYGAGERQVRAVVRGHDEIAELARVFNDTAERLQAQATARERLTSDLAHELRTPLTILRSELEAVQDGLMVADSETLEQLLQQVQLLTRLVVDLRELAQAESGEMTLSRADTDLLELVTRSVGAFSSRAAAAGVALVPELIAARALVDAPRVMQVLNALLDNALAHAPAGSRVTVRLQPQAEMVLLEVLDEGPGIPAAHLAQVFERLYRLDAARGRRPGGGGSGLGLAIVAAIVALHGGRVSADQRPAGGAALRVWLPQDGRRVTSPGPRAFE